MSEKMPACEMCGNPTALSLVAVVQETSDRVCVECREAWDRFAASYAARQHHGQDATAPDLALASWAADYADALIAERRKRMWKP